MPNQYTDEEWCQIFNMVWENEDDQINLTRMINKINRYPKEGLKYLLLHYYAEEQIINANQLELKMFPLAPSIYLATISFLDWFEQYYLSLRRAAVSEEANQQLEYIRRFCRAMLLISLAKEELPLTGKRRLSMALAKMRETDILDQQLKFENKLPFDSGEVVAKLSYYLKQAEELADSPDFLPIYFNSDQLAPFNADLTQNKLSPFSRKNLQQLLEAGKIREVKQILRQLMFHQEIIPRAKQAFALYLSLDNTGINWADHPFFRRFLFNSFLESEVSKIKINNKLGK